MVAELPSNVNYGYITGRILQAIGDTLDVDRFPDGIPAQGNVLFTPSISHLINVSASPPTVIIPKPITCTLNSDGVLTGPDNQPGLWLIATDDPDNNPINWTYEVSFLLVGNTLPSFSVMVPTGDESNPVDLSLAIPVPSSPGVGLPNVEAAAIQAAASAIAAQAAAEQMLEELQNAIQEAASNATLPATAAAQSAANDLAEVLQVVEEGRPGVRVEHDPDGVPVFIFTEGADDVWLDTDPDGISVVVIG